MRAFYSFAADKRKLATVAKFNELHEKGGERAVEKAMAKRRKHTASKMHTQIPRSRMQAD